MTVWSGAAAQVGSNTGIRATLVIEQLHPANAPGFPYISQSFQNNMWAQLAYDPPSGMWNWQVWDLSPYHFVTGGHGKVVTVGEHTLEIVLARKGLWEFIVDGGKPLASYSIGSAVGRGDFELIAENGVPTDPAFTFKGASYRNSSGVWEPAAHANAFLIRDDISAPWLGVAGADQDPTLPAGSVRIGGPQTVSGGVSLW